MFKASLDKVHLYTLAVENSVNGSKSTRGRDSEVVARVKSSMIDSLRDDYFSKGFILVKSAKSSFDVYKFEEGDADISAINTGSLGVYAYKVDLSKKERCFFINTIDSLQDTLELAAVCVEGNVVKYVLNRSVLKEDVLNNRVDCCSIKNDKLYLHVKRM